MENNEVLRKAIAKAVKNGFRLIPIGYLNINNDLVVGLNNLPKDNCGFYVYYHIIFDHEFARAFWGSQKCCMYCGDIDKKDNGDVLCWCDERKIGELWQYHLSKMVLEPEPLKYLEKYL